MTVERIRKILQIYLELAFLSNRNEFIKLIILNSTKREDVIHSS